MCIQINIFRTKTSFKKNEMKLHSLTTCKIANCVVHNTFRKPILYLFQVPSSISKGDFKNYIVHTSE